MSSLHFECSELSVNRERFVTFIHDKIIIEVSMTEIIPSSIFILLTLIFCTASATMKSCCMIASAVLIRKFMAFSNVSTLKKQAKFGKGLVLSCFGDKWGIGFAYKIVLIPHY